MARKRNNSPDELNELDSIYESMTGNKKSRPKSKAPAVLFICIASLLLLAAIGVGVWFLFSDNWLKLDSITISGIDMNGMSKAEAKEALTKQVEELYHTKPMVVTVGNTTLQLDPKDANIKLDVNEAINEAYQKGDDFDLSKHLTLDEAAVDALVASFDAQYNTELVKTEYSVEGTLPSLTTSTAEEGTGLTLVVRLGKPDYGLDTVALRASIMEAYANGTMQVECKFTSIEPAMPDVDDLFDTYLSQYPAKDAVMVTSPFGITPETYGYTIDLQKAKTLLENANYGDTVRIPFTFVAPKTTAADLENTLFQDILGECSTPYSGSDDNNRNTNLRLACEKVDGIVLMPGEEFSYNKALGERTKENGWKPAASYVGGLTVDTYGGGICQGSTTLYNCVLQADFKLTQCYPHGYVSAYVPHGMDAAVNWPNVDFRFINTSNYPIRIEAYRKDGYMTMRIYGTDEKDYYIKMTYQDISYKAYKVVYEEVDPANNPKGYKDGQELVSPYTGLRVKTYKNRYDKVTHELISTTLERDVTYSHRDQVIVKFVTKTDPPATDGEGAGDTP